ncbi:MAG: hypothetical protein V1799_03100 [bacterium]
MSQNQMIGLRRIATRVHWSSLWLFVIGAVGAALFFGCGTSEDSKTIVRPVVPESFDGPTGGLKWSHPSRWIKADHGSSLIRLYIIPQSVGDPEPAQCSIYLVSTPLPGDTVSVLGRVVREFQDVTFSDRDVVEKNGFMMTSIHLTGTYLKRIGIVDTLKAENCRMLGVLVEGTEGNVFFKLVGLNKTVIDAAGEFNQLLNSIAMRKE